MANRGLYHQLQGDEHVSSADAFANRVADNELIEGPFVKRIRALTKAHDWTALEVTVQDMKASGFSQDRIDAVIRQSSFGARL